MEQGLGSLGVALAVASIMYCSKGEAAVAAGFVGVIGFTVIWLFGS